MRTCIAVVFFNRHAPDVNQRLNSESEGMSLQNGSKHQAPEFLTALHFAINN